MFQMMEALAKFIDVPAEKAASADSSALPAEGGPRPFTVHTSAQQPTDPFAVAKYRGDWYWIDHEDPLSKRIFTVMLFLTKNGIIKVTSIFTINGH